MPPVQSNLAAIWGRHDLTHPSGVDQQAIDCCSSTSSANVSPSIASWLHSGKISERKPQLRRVPLDHHELPPFGFGASLSIS